jgi:hypothetical protein
MKLRFLCANHRQWLFNEPEQAMHSCANSFETGWHLCQQENWQEALPQMGCAFETAEILLTTRAMTASRAVDWFLRTLQGLTQALEKLHRMEQCREVYQAAIDRLRNEVARGIAPELEAQLYSHITRLNRARKQLDAGRQMLAPMHALRETSRGDIVYH